MAYDEKRVAELVAAAKRIQGERDSAHNDDAPREEIRTAQETPPNDTQTVDPKDKELMWAAQEGDLGRVRALIQAGANVNAVNLESPARMTPLIYAASKGHAEVVHELLQNDADIRMGTPLGHTALFYAAIGGNEETIAVLATHAPELVDICDNEDSTPLMHAAMKGSFETLRALIECGADVNLTNKLWQSVLFSLMAMRNADGTHAADIVEKARLLIKSGAKVDEPNCFQMTPLMVAVRQGNPAAIRYLLEEAGANPELKDTMGHNALMHATIEGTVEDMRILIDHKVDLEAVSRQGRTALMMAAACTQSMDKVDLLLNAGANMLPIDNSGYTAYQHARENPAIKDKLAPEPFSRRYAFYPTRSGRPENQPSSAPLQTSKSLSLHGS